MEEHAKRKLTAILSADVKGYSRLMQDDEEATVRTVTAYREVMTNLIQGHHGRVVDAKGDNILAEFPSVVDAVRCGVEIQKELKTRNADIPENRKMEWRIGINLGDVIENGDTIYGDGVNIAARIEGLAEGGGICLSGTAFDQVEGKLGFEFEYLGEQSLKNINKPVRVYRVKVKDSVSEVEISRELPLPDKPSIAVLPFVNMSGDPEQEYFSDGISEEIITALSKTPKLFVIARTSSFKYKGKEVDVRTIGRELGVRYVLEGSVRKAGNTVRISAQLIDAKTNNHLWADRYDRDLKDIFTIQDDITKNIITSVQVKLTLGEQGTLSSEGTKNLDAYLHILQAWDHMWQFNKEDNMKARQLAEKAIALDPEYDKGYTALAGVENADVWLGVSESPKEAMMRCIELAKKSIAIKDSAVPHRVLANTYLLLRKHSAAVEEVKKAIEMAPNYADAYWILGLVYMQSDRGEEAVPVLQKAIRLNPFPPNAYYNTLAWSYYFLGKYDEAIAEGKRAVSMNPKDFHAHLPLICAYLSMNRREEARAHAADILRIDPNFSVNKAERTTPLKNKDNLKRIMEQYRMAGLPD